MSDVVSRPEAAECAIACPQTGEQDDVRTGLTVGDVSKPRGTRRGGHGLAFPMDEFRADGVVPIPRCRREIAIALVESEGEDIRLRRLVSTHSFAPFRRLRTGPVAEGGENLRTGVARMYA